MIYCRDRAALSQAHRFIAVLMLLRSVGALVVSSPAATAAATSRTRAALTYRGYPTTTSYLGGSAAANRLPTTAAVARAPARACCRSRLPSMSASNTVRRRRTAVAAHRKRVCGASLSATIASSLPAVEDAADSGPTAPRSNGNEASAGEGLGERLQISDDDAGPGLATASRSSGVVLIEQEGPAWTEIVWDQGKERFVGAKSLLDRSNSQKVRGAVGGLQLLVRHWFIPEDVTPDYYHFTLWRMFQRFVAGTINVFGTQALLLALGIKSRRLGAAAAMSWVLKDALGKFGRILWASKMGRRFDSDAKRWRYRSSLLYATGNGLEIVTYVFPASFLILAAAANSFKQMSMLTSSATRNTIYRSFARGENIGDITAKGEAQIAVVDLLGMLSGIGLCTLVGTSRNSIVAAYAILSLIDISAIYNEIRAVVFTVLNHERTHILAGDYVASGSNPSVMAQARTGGGYRPLFRKDPASSKDAPAHTPNSDVGGPEDDAESRSVSLTAATAPAAVRDQDGDANSNRSSGEELGATRLIHTGAVAEDGPAPQRSGDQETLGETVFVAAVNNNDDSRSSREGVLPNATVEAVVTPGIGDTVKGKGEAATAAAAVAGSDDVGRTLLSSPSTVSRRENIFLASRLTTDAFKTWSQAGVSMQEVTDLLRIFGDERYMLAYAESGGRGGSGRKTGSGASDEDKKRPKGGKGVASVILHRDASGADTVKSLLALEYFQDELAKAGFAVVGARPKPISAAAQEAAEGLMKDKRHSTSASTSTSSPERVNGDSGGGSTEGAARDTVAVEGWGTGGRSRARRSEEEVSSSQKAEGAGDGDRDRDRDIQRPSVVELRRCLAAAKRRADDGAPGFFEALRILGWSTEKFMFGNIKSRVEWRQ